MNIRAYRQLKKHLLFGKIIVPEGKDICVPVGRCNDEIFDSRVQH